MTEITPFTFPATGQTVRTVTVDDEPWFIAKDACEVIGVIKYRDAVAQLDADERMSVVVDTPGGPQLMSAVNEAGVYTLMMISRSPQVKPFRRWVTHDVLPAIRKTGSYSLADFPVPTNFAEALELAARQQRELEVVATRALAAEHELLELAPAAHAWDTLASADGDYSVREAGYILNRDPAIKTGERRLFDLLRTWRLVDWRDIPYANHAQHVRLRPRSFTNRATGEEMPAKPQVRVTAAGVRYLHKRLGGTANVADLLAEPVAA